MPDEIPIAKIESVVLDAAVPIILIIAGALLVLRFERWDTASMKSPGSEERS